MAPVTPNTFSSVIEVPVALDFPQAATGPYPVTGTTHMGWERNNTAPQYDNLIVCNEYVPLKLQDLDIRINLATGLSFATATQFNANRQDLRDSITGSTGFNAVMAASNPVLTVRISDSSAGIGLLRVADWPGYNISSTDTITGSIPASVLATGIGPLALNNLYIRHTATAAAHAFFQRVAIDSVTSGTVTGLIYDQHFTWCQINTGLGTGEVPINGGTYTDRWGNSIVIPTTTPDVGTWSSAYTYNAASTIAARSFKFPGPENQNFLYVQAAVSDLEVPMWCHSPYNASIACGYMVEFPG